MPRRADGPPAAAEVDRALAEVLARPEFTERSFPGPLARLLEIYQQARAVLGRWFAELFLNGSGGSVILWLLVIVLALTALAILLHFTRVARQGWLGRGARTAHAGAGAPPRDRGADAWEAEARRAAEARRWREAALALYQALLHRLDERGAVRYDAAKTPGDYRREARRAPRDAARTLDSFLRLWEPLVFGGRPVDAPRYAQLREIAAQGGVNG